MTERDTPLNPGSDAAIARGCTCPVLDNGHGSGWLGGTKDPETGETLFVINFNCPVHGLELPEMALASGADHD